VVKAAAPSTRFRIPLVVSPAASPAAVAETMMMRTIVVAAEPSEGFCKPR
jgi:hypothetical protein